MRDLFFDDHSLKIRYICVDTGNWLPGRKVLIAPAWMRGIDWAERKVHVEADKQTIKKAPAYEAGMTIDQALERCIFQRYGPTPHAAE